MAHHVYFSISPSIVVGKSRKPVYWRVTTITFPETSAWINFRNPSATSATLCRENKYWSKKFLTADNDVEVSSNSCSLNVIPSQ